MGQVSLYNMVNKEVMVVCDVRTLLPRRMWVYGKVAPQTEFVIPEAKP